MGDRLSAGTLLAERYRISEMIGSGDESAAYLAADLDQGGAWALVWESLLMFRMRRKPPGALQYLALRDRHYLVLRLEGTDLGLVYSAAGTVEESWAAMWISQVCDSIGQWHSRVEDPVVCLRFGDIRLAHLRLLSTGRAILPSCDLLAQPFTPVVAGQALGFTAPEKVLGERLTARSDVYALGAALYCLATGTPPPDPGPLKRGEVELVPPRKVHRQLSGRLEKVILKAMALEPSRRFESATQLSFELDRCVPRRLRRHNVGAY